GAVSDSEIAAEKHRLYELTKTAEGQAELHRNGSLMMLAQKASLGANHQRTLNQQRVLAEHQRYAMERLSQPPTWSFSVSGGLDLSQYNSNAASLVGDMAVDDDNNTQASDAIGTFNDQS